MCFVYILACRQTGRSYVGHTDDLIRRYRAHLAGSTRTTREKLIEPFVAYWEPLPDRKSAARRERYFKSGSGYRVRADIVRSELQASSVG